MISYLKGTIKDKRQKFIILLVNNVGYKIHTTNKFLEKTKQEQQVELFIHLRQNDDSINLYGFPRQEELQLFELLLSITGVGPRHALGVLELSTAQDIKKAILRDDPSILYKVSGVGKKTAERIVVELKNKLDSLPTDEKKIPLDDTDTEAFDALTSLGYSDPDIRQAIKRLPADITKTEEKIKQCLKFLG